MNQEEMHEIIRLKLKNWKHYGYDFYCGWCESFIPDEDIEQKRYKTFAKSKSTLSMMQDDNFFIVCLKCVEKFEEIKSLKEV
tara:strand:- start:138 stop:383 length:246 start_codon:yes stop_codon:yes gene_type:complete